MILTRREIMMATGAMALAPKAAHAVAAREITWDDLIPVGVPYGEIIGQGVMDEAEDTWRPEFDANGSILNDDLDGAYIKMPGYIVPIEQSIQGVTKFILVPYVGACVHTPPPPPNQLVFTHTKDPWPQDNIWDAIWVTGQLTHFVQSTEIADTGYALAADKIELYKWE